MLQDVAIALLFGIGYACIIFEESLAFNKIRVWLLMDVSLWVVRSIGVSLAITIPNHQKKMILILICLQFIIDWFDEKKRVITCNNIKHFISCIGIVMDWVELVIRSLSLYLLRCNCLCAFSLLITLCSISWLLGFLV